ncbi:hypothetical protein GCM10023168_25770 [Fodinibacter luteus]|uniref:Mycothiol-dependent maleylpyruvate isomerase metal-binding domain-containing protein n=1 Tax=Fodinibacter luteus TaxID=552064 RepID=A0ABP8KJC0_9MICO
MRDGIQVRDGIQRSWQTFLERLTEHPECWGAPTRLAGWAVSDLAAHACWGTSLEADAVERALRGDSEAAQGRSPEPGASRDEVLDALRRSCGRLVAALDALEERAAADPRAVPESLPMPYGDVSVPLAGAIFTMEAGVHGSDLAAAVGDDDTLAPDVCRATFATLAVFGPVLSDAAGTVPPPGVVIEVRGGGDCLRFGADDQGRWTSAATSPVRTTITGSPSDVALFLLGRRGVDAVTVHGDGAPAARFKEYLPGP